MWQGETDDKMTANYKRVAAIKTYVHLIKVIVVKNKHTAVSSLSFFGFG
jgi:hypothetical protein